MAHRKIHSRHPVKVGRIKLALATRPVAGWLSKELAKQIDHRVQNRDMGNAFFGAAGLELGAKISVDDAHHQNAGVALQSGKNSFDMVQAAHQCPDMFNGPYIRKLGHAGARDLMHGFPGGI